MSDLYRLGYPYYEYCKQVYDSYFPNDVRNEGLPNVGFTCFLNSIIQILYSVETMREQIIKNESKHQFVQSLANIFVDIKEKKLMKVKQNHLRIFVKNLEKLIPNYSKYTMQDALEFMLIILNELRAVDSSYVQQFEISYEVTCKCQDHKAAFTDLYMTLGKLKCQTCNKQLNITVTQPSEYLILLCSVKAQRRNDKRFNNDMLKYDLCSQILYDGNGTFGHYMAQRKREEKFYQFDDQYVREPKKWGRPLIMLFKIDKLFKIDQKIKEQVKEQVKEPAKEPEPEPQSQNQRPKTAGRNLIKTPCHHFISENIFYRKLANLIKLKNYELKCMKSECLKVWDWQQLKTLNNLTHQIAKQYEQCILKEKKQSKIQIQEEKKKAVDDKKRQSENAIQNEENEKKIGKETKMESQEKGKQSNQAKAGESHLSQIQAETSISSPGQSLQNFQIPRTNTYPQNYPYVR